jgi:hypothetical protein
MLPQSGRKQTDLTLGTKDWRYLQSCPRSRRGEDGEFALDGPPER